LRWIGAAYLIYIGYQMLRHPRRSFLPEAPRDAGSRRAFTTGVLTNLLNPKVGVFYVTFLPQFVPAGANIAGYTFLLACIHVLLGGFWFAALIIATLPLRRLLARPRVVKAMDRLTGCVFVAFGVTLALARRP
jgi:threonine/homoserine/homoserine lactone efflux protein